MLIQLDYDASGFLQYAGWALSSSALTSQAVWRICHPDWGAEDLIEPQWADGNGDFDNVWDDRTSLTYSANPDIALDPVLDLLSTDGAGTLGLLDPTQAFIKRNVFGAPALILGPVDPTADIAGGNAVANFGIYDNNQCIFAMRGDTARPNFVLMYLANANDAAGITVFRARGESWAGRTQPNVGDGLFAFFAGSFKANGDQMDDGAGAFGFEVDGVFPDWVAARLGFSIMFNDGQRRHPLYCFPSGLFTLGADLRSSPPSGENVHIEPWFPDQIAAVVRGAASQTADLQQWRKNDGTVYARVTANGGVFLNALPTSDPGVPGQLWRDGAVVKVSL